jgi:hypothetical protein
LRRPSLVNRAIDPARPFPESRDRSRLPVRPWCSTPSRTLALLLLGLHSGDCLGNLLLGFVAGEILDVASVELTGLVFLGVRRIVSRRAWLRTLGFGRGERLGFPVFGVPFRLTAQSCQFVDAVLRGRLARLVVLGPRTLRRWFPVFRIAPRSQAASFLPPCLPARVSLLHS